MTCILSFKRLTYLSFTKLTNLLATDFENSVQLSLRCVQLFANLWPVPCQAPLSIGFPMQEYESWSIKKSEHRRTDALELWCWKRLLKVPWTAKRSNQSMLKEINPECSLEGQMLKLKFLGRADSLEKNLIGKIEGRQEGGNRG